MKPPILWNRMCDDTNLIQSVIGTNFTKTGTPTYSSVKFNNGINGDSANYGNLGYVLPATFTIEFWLKYNHAKADMGNKYFLRGGVVGINFQFWIGSIYPDIQNGNKIQSQFVLPDYNANDIVHWGTIFDMTATPKVRFFYNGNEISVNGIWYGGDWTGSNTNLSTQGEAGWIENLKIYEYAKTNFDDRFNERGGMNDIVKLM